MKNYTEYTGLGAAIASYPSGQPLDGASGTLLNVTSYGDVFSFFWKCVREAGVTPNGLADNENDGYQLFDSVQKAVLGETSWVTVTAFTNGAAASTGPSDGNGVRYRKSNGGKIVEVEGWLTPTSTSGLTAFTLPVGYRPSGYANMLLVANDGALGNVVFSTDGTVKTDLGGVSSVYIRASLTLD